MGQDQTRCQTDLPGQGEQIARTVALLKLGQMTDQPTDDIATFALENVIALTGSTIGYIAFVNDDETVLTMHYWSKNAMQECAIIDKPIVYPSRTPDFGVRQFACESRSLQTTTPLRVLGRKVRRRAMSR